MNSLLTIVIFTLLWENSFSINAKGCTPLDSWSFDKIISKFPVSVVKFDKAFPYGKKQDEYAKFASAARSSDNLLVAEVGVKDYGDMQNADLAKRFDINAEEFPIVKLFFADETKERDFSGEFTLEGLKKFVRQNSEVYIGLEHCLEEFDEIVDEFMKIKDLNQRKDLLLEAQNQLTLIKNPDNKFSAETYIKVMSKTLEKGDDFASIEQERVEGIMKSKMTEDKKNQLQSKINILKSFIHEEL